MFLFFFKMYILNIFFIDLIYRIDFNDNLVNFYNFFWTNFWYLPFFLTYSYICCSYFLNFSYIYRTTIIILLLLYMLEINNYFLSNFQCYFFNFNLNNFNFFLLNNINKYHPGIFYLSLFLTTFVFFLFFSNYNNFKFFFIGVFTWNLIIFLFFLIFLLNLYSLFLGSWWALQEGSWGGWWNWDASETFGLFFLINSLFFIHYGLKRNIFINFNYLFLIGFFFIWFNYYFIQLNFDITSHNFGIKFFFFFNNNLFLIELIFIFLIFIYFQLNSFFSISRNFSFFFKIYASFSFSVFYKYIACSLLLLVTIKPVFFSLSPLFNYFLWNFFLINSFNYESITVVELGLIILLLIFVFIKINKSIFSQLFLIALDNFVLYLSFEIKQFKYVYYFIHFFFINFLLSNLFSLEISLNLQELVQFQSEFFSEKITQYHFNNISLNSFFIELTNGFKISSDSIISSAYFNLLTPFNFLFFNFFSTNANLYNILFLNSVSAGLSFLYLESFFINNLLVFSNFLLLLFIKLFQIYYFK